jgi:hypothetical protein
MTRECPPATRRRCRSRPGTVTRSVAVRRRRSRSIPINLHRVAVWIADVDGGGAAPAADGDVRATQTREHGAPAPGRHVEAEMVEAAAPRCEATPRDDEVDDVAACGAQNLDQSSF